MPIVEPVSDASRMLVEIAEKWQRRWGEARIFEADPAEGKPKFFITAAFPYPNSPLHIGHARTYSIADAYARFKRMQGYNVLFPMAFHYTGTPILAMAESIAKGDKELIDLFIEVYDIPPEDVSKLSTPRGMADYFSRKMKEGMIKTGFSIDWRREFRSIDPEFSQMIIWQFNKLREKGYLTKGTHPVGWCPYHQMPVGMHDTKNDVEPEIGEFKILLFETRGGEYMAAATLRPETVFGAVNMWVNPNATYVKARVNGKTWIISKRAAYKLGFQRKVEVVGEETRGEKLLGMRVRNPATGAWIPVLPGEFVDPGTATGVVMSVPAHAPYDYASLRDLMRDEEKLRRLGVRPEELKPIPLIRVEGYSEIPARDAVEKRGIRSQLEREKLDDATKEIYAAEFRRGVVREDIVDLALRDMPEPARSYAVAAVKAWIAGRRVEEARDAAWRWLAAAGLADSMYEIMNRPVYCRCGTEIVVKVLENQWFIDYGREEWKQAAREALADMRIVPEEMRREFEATIEWLREKACARTRGLGTRLPWASDWIIESLSDSTIYMAFYTVSHKIRENKLKPEQLTSEFWDYVLLGKGDPEELSRRIGVPARLLEDMRREFDYWYPVDSRHSARELIPNHLTFYIFNHVALFPREYWPRQIVANGVLLYEGKKMSKSLRNIVPLIRANQMYGADAVRMTLLAAAEIGQDADFRDSLARSMAERLVRLLDLAKQYSRSPKPPERLRHIDRWMLSMLQRRIEKATRAMENVRIREAIHQAFYLLDQDVKWYQTRASGLGEGSEGNVEWVMHKVLLAWVRLLAPFAPHVAEEAWSILGGEGFVSLAEWPRIDEQLIDEEAELGEEYVKRMLSDISNIASILRSKPRRAVIYVAPRDEYRVLAEAARHIETKRSMRDFIRSVIAAADDKKRAAVKARMIYELASKIPPELRSRIKPGGIDEYRLLSENIKSIKRLTGLEEVKVYRADDPDAPSLGGKKRQALPFKPAIYLE